MLLSLDQMLILYNNNRVYFVNNQVQNSLKYGDINNPARCYFFILQANLVLK